MKLTKLIIGSAQFGQRYGVDNKRVNQKEIKKLLNYLKKRKNYKIIFDSSPNYGDSEKIILKMNTASSAIITKIKDIPKKAKEIKTYIEEFVNNFKKKSNQKNIYAVLLHDEKDLSNIRRLRIIVKILQKMKNQRIIKKYGFSIYDYKKYRNNILRIKPDILQFPYNLVDDRVKIADFKELKKKNISLHARSIFLQGLLLYESNNLPKKFERFRKIWKYYNLEVKKNNQSMVQACLNHILCNRYIDKIVIGFQSLKQLKEIHETQAVKKKIIFPKLQNKDQLFLINPHKW